MPYQLNFVRLEANRIIEYPVLFLTDLKVGLKIMGLLPLSQWHWFWWDTFSFSPLKMLGSRDWKIEMSVLDTRPYHNPYLFSYPVHVHELYEVGHVSIQERGSSVSSIVATVNFLHPKYQCLQVVSSFRSLRKQGAGLGWWQNRDMRQCSPPQLLLFYLSHPTAYKLPSSLESSRATFSGIVQCRSFIWSACEAWFGQPALQPGIDDIFLRGKPGDYRAVGISHLKSESLHCWVRKGISPRFCEYCSSHPAWVYFHIAFMSFRNVSNQCEILYSTWKRPSPFAIQSEKIRFHVNPKIFIFFLKTASAAFLQIRPACSSS